jgi:hypothetical protein
VDLKLTKQAFIKLKMNQKQKPTKMRVEKLITLPIEAAFAS